MSFSFAGQLPWEGTLDMLPRRGDGRRAADVESDDIDKQSGNGQGTEQQCLLYFLYGSKSIIEI